MSSGKGRSFCVDLNVLTIHNTQMYDERTKRATGFTTELWPLLLTSINSHSGPDK